MLRELGRSEGDAFAGQVEDGSVEQLQTEDLADQAEVGEQRVLEFLLHVQFLEQSPLVGKIVVDDRQDSENRILLGAILEQPVVD